MLTLNHLPVYPYLGWQGEILSECYLGCLLFGQSQYVSALNANHNDI